MTNNKKEIKTIYIFESFSNNSFLRKISEKNIPILKKIKYLKIKENIAKLIGNS
jgi:hypothetical protein